MWKNSSKLKTYPFDLEQDFFFSWITR